MTVATPSPRASEYDAAPVSQRPASPTSADSVPVPRPSVEPEAASTATGSPEATILLDLPFVRIVCDALGAVALFTFTAIALSVADAIAVTLLVGMLVLGSRLVRSVRAGRGWAAVLPWTGSPRTAASSAGWDDNGL